MSCIDCMRYIDSIMFIVFATDPATHLNNGTGSQVTTVNNTVFITYPMGELYIESPVASIYNRTFSSLSINVKIIKLENKYMYEVGSRLLIPVLVSVKVNVNVSVRIVNQKPRTRNQFPTDILVLCYNLTSCFPHKQLAIQYLGLYFDIMGIIEIDPCLHSNCTHNVYQSMQKHS